MNGAEVLGLSEGGGRWEERPRRRGLVCRLSPASQVAVQWPQWQDNQAEIPPLQPEWYLAQESLYPPDTNLEWVGWRDPNTLRADPGLPVLRPRNASATLTQMARLPLGRYTGSSQPGLPGPGSSQATYQHTDTDTQRHTKTHKRHQYRGVDSQAHTHTPRSCPGDTQRHSFFTDLPVQHKYTWTGTHIPQACWHTQTHTYQPHPPALEGQEPRVSLRHTLSQGSSHPQVGGPPRLLRPPPSSAPCHFLTLHSPSVTPGPLSPDEKLMATCMQFSLADTCPETFLHQTLWLWR